MREKTADIPVPGLGQVPPWAGGKKKKGFFFAKGLGGILGGGFWGWVELGKCRLVMEKKKKKVVVGEQAVPGGGVCWTCF